MTPVAKSFARRDQTDDCTRGVGIFISDRERLTTQFLLESANNLAEVRFVIHTHEDVLNHKVMFHHVAALRLWPDRLGPSRRAGASRPADEAVRTGSTTDAPQNASRY